MNRTHWAMLALLAMLLAGGASIAEAQVVTLPSPIDGAMTVDAPLPEVDLRTSRRMAGFGLGLFPGVAFASFASLVWSAYVPPAWALTAPLMVGTIALLAMGIRGVIRLVQEKRLLRARERGAVAVLSPGGDPSLATVWSF